VAPRARSGRFRLRRLSLAALVGFAVVGLVPGAHAAPDEIYQPATWNGYRIYLSPADHANGGCGDYIESTNMHRVAHSAATGTTIGAGSLQDRGYKVRIRHGTLTEGVSRSNNWPSHRHIPLHSNARSSSQCGYSSGGTQTYYYPGSTRGEDLARKLKNLLGEVSPGAALEYVDTRPGLYELYATTMPAAYVEAEFHDWTQGKNWLVNYPDWSWRIGYAVDLHLGYPR
jgi:hypothetical protein